jgi:hypothetical protein
MTRNGNVMPHSLLSTFYWEPGFQPGGPFTPGFWYDTVVRVGFQFVNNHSILLSGCLLN